MSKNRNVIPGLAIHYTENYIREKAEKNLKYMIKIQKIEKR